jgi:hypothetical protein
VPVAPGFAARARSFYSNNLCAISMTSLVSLTTLAKKTNNLYMITVVDAQVEGAHGGDEMLWR